MSKKKSKKKIEELTKKNAHLRTSLALEEGKINQVHTDNSDKTEKYADGLYGAIDAIFTALDLKLVPLTHEDDDIAQCYECRVMHEFHVQK